MLSCTPTATLSGGGNFCAPETEATVVLTGTAGATVTVNGVDYVIEADGSNDILLGVGTYSISNVSLAGCNNTGNGNVSVTNVGCLGTIGDLVYVDENGNGVEDPGEGELAASEGITLTLVTDLDGDGVIDADETYYDANGNGIQDAGETAWVMPLNADGSYLYSGVIPGNYIVSVNVPSGSGLTLVSAGQYAVPLGAGGTFVLSADFILPIEFMSFNALSNCNDVNIAWSVGNETDVLQYNIQRSIDGINWENIGSIESSHTATAQSYSYVDLYRAFTETYYRVVAVGVAGETKATNVAITKTECLDITQIHVFPNPTTGTLTYEVNSSYSGKVLVVVIDELGRTHIEQEVTLALGLNSFSLDVSKLAQAMYFTGVNGMTESKYVKFYKID